MFKKSFFHSISAGLISSIACYLYVSILRNEFMYDFSEVLSISNVVGACFFSCILASIFHTLANHFLPKMGDILFHVFFAVIVFASLLGPMLFKLPLDFDKDLTLIFPTYAMVLHFFPALIWLTLKPIFNK